MPDNDPPIFQYIDHALNMSKELSTHRVLLLKVVSDKGQGDTFHLSIRRDALEKLAFDILNRLPALDEATSS